MDVIVQASRVRRDRLPRINPIPQEVTESRRMHKAVRARLEWVQIDLKEVELQG